MPRPARSRARLIAIAATCAALVLSASALTACGNKAPATGTTSSTAAPQSGATQPGTAKPATNGSASATATSSAGKGAQPAWRMADKSWMDRYKGVLIDGFKTQPGYKAVALTFDDGPNGETAYVINTLKKYNGHATFFDTGRKLKMKWAKGQPALIERSGNELGNHTMHHTLPDGISSMWRRTLAIDLAEINDMDAIVQGYGGQTTTWLRPMGGMIDANGIKACVQTDHLAINWTIDSNDSHGGPRTPDYIYTQCTTNVSSGDVILLHVTHPESMQALPRICQTLTQQGYKLVTLSELAQHSTAPIVEKLKK